MKKLFKAADHYIETSDWKIIAVLKFCLISLGLIIGVLLPRESRKPVLAGAGTVFLLTYIPLMAKFFKAFQETRED